MSTKVTFERIAQFVVEVARGDPTGDDLVTLALAATYMLPENVRIRSLCETHASPGRL